MKKYHLILLTLVLALGFILSQQYSSSVFSGWRTNTDQILLNAFNNKQSNLQVRGQGQTTRLLPDDLKGSKHQRVIVTLGNGLTLLIAHNIDLAPRIKTLSEGDKLEFFGEYEWSAKGGVIHWTHKDPAGQHVDGWLKHQGKIYQ